jgi:hypothetical protein
VKEHWLVDERFSVEEWNEPAARVQHLPRQLGVVRLIWIEQAGVTEPPKHDDPADRDPPD